ncbi:MAG: 3',5'-cyclic-nucleotide phosphodiesterase [Thermoanaerobaculia bacterium]
MDLRILGCFGGALPGHRTTNFLVNRHTAIDAGALAHALTFDEQRSLRHVLITHAHLDHTGGLPFVVDNVFGQQEKPLDVYSISPVIESMKRHLFNDDTWPDFSKLPTEKNPVLRFHEIEAGKPFEIEGVRYTAIPVNHIVPCVGYLIDGGASSVLFSSDTGPCPALYERANAVPNLRALITEVSFPNSMQDIADLSRHLTPRGLARELAQLERRVDVLLYHLKPPFVETLHAEVHELGLDFVRCLDQDATYTFE